MKEGNSLMYSIYGYMVSDIWFKDYLDIQRANPIHPLHGLLLMII